MAKRNETKEAVTGAKYTKEQFLKSNTYRQYKDLLNGVLDDKKTYTKEQVNDIINKFYRKGKSE